MSRKIVGITCSSSQKQGENAKQFLNNPYALAVAAAGGIPVILPNIGGKVLIEGYLSAIDGLMLSGGVDVSPERFEQEAHPELGEVDLARDAMEFELIAAALKQDMPIFGICRGIQALNVAMGGTLYQDLPSQAPSAICHTQGDNKVPRNQPSHSITVNANTRLRAILGSETMKTNSFHHQALNNVAAGLVVTAHAEDGIIEAVEGPDYRYLVAVQFHPEETAPTDSFSQKLFCAFVNAL